jgi:DNA-binding CsgD family transcriptional regulator
VRELLVEELRQSHAAAQAAETAFKMRVYLAVEQGATTQEIADELGISQTSASKYRMQGEALHRKQQAAGS